MSLSDTMVGMVRGISLHKDVAVEVPTLTDGMFKKIDHELVKGGSPKSREESGGQENKEIYQLPSLKAGRSAPTDAMEGVKESPIYIHAPQSQLEQPGELKLPEVKLKILHASKIKKDIGRKAKTSSFSPPASPPCNLSPLLK